MGGRRTKRKGQTANEPIDCIDINTTMESAVNPPNTGQEPSVEVRSGETWNVVKKNGTVKKLDNPALRSQAPVITGKKDSSTTIIGEDNHEIVADPNHILEVRTYSGNIFKNLLDTLKAVLNEANIVFSDQGLKLAAVDTNKFALVHLFMEASSFEFYHCRQQKLTLGVDIEKLHKTIKTVKVNDQMCFVVKESNPSYLEITFENQRGDRSTDKIKLLSLDDYGIKDNIKYDEPPKIESAVFQSICRDMSSLHATLLEIQIKGDRLLFRNLDGEQERILNMKIETQGNYEDVRGVYQLKFLKSFAKAANLSPQVKLYMRNECPLICEYTVSNLGLLRYVLAGEE